MSKKQIIIAVVIVVLIIAIVIGYRIYQKKKQKTLLTKTGFSAADANVVFTNPFSESMFEGNWDSWKVGQKIYNVSGKPLDMKMYLNRIGTPVNAMATSYDALVGKKIPSGTLTDTVVTSQEIGTVTYIDNTIVQIYAAPYSVIAVAKTTFEEKYKGLITAKK